MLSQLIKNKVIIKDQLIGLALFLSMLLCMLPTQVSADSAITIERMSAEKQGESIQVSCEVSYRLDEKVKEALTNGIKMTFITNLELLEDTRNWFDQVKGRYQKTFSLKYHALSKQFVLSINNEERSYPDLFSVFYKQDKLCDFRIGPIDHLQMSKSIYLRAHIRLVTESLPLPLRMKSYLSKDWRPSSGWTVWPI